jgi:hypothetical protein
VRSAGGGAEVATDIDSGGGQRNLIFIDFRINVLKILAFQKCHQIIPFLLGLVFAQVRNTQLDPLPWLYLRLSWIYCLLGQTGYNAYPVSPKPQ